MRYPDNPAVLTVLHSFAQAKICRISFGFDFTKCNYRVFSYPTDGKLPLSDLYSYQLLSEENKAFLLKLNEELEKIGTTYGECEGGWYNGTLPCVHCGGVSNLTKTPGFSPLAVPSVA